MRSLSLRFATVLFVLLLPLGAAHADVTVSGTVSFTSLDGSASDADHLANGVFTVSGDLIVNGRISCSDDPPRSASCAMSFVASRDVIVNAGGSLLAENNHGSGNGANITVSAGRDLILKSATVTLPAAVISSAGNQSGNSVAGNITLTAANNATVESGAAVSAASEKNQSGAVQLTGGGHVDVSGVVASGPGRVVSPLGKYIGQPLVGGSGNQRGGAITIRSTSFTEPGLTVGTDALIVSQSNSNDPGLVKLEGCGIVVKGAVEAIGDNAASKVAIRSGKSMTIDSRDLGVLVAPGGRTGIVRAGSTVGVSQGDNVAEAKSAGAVESDGLATDSFVHLYAADNVEVLGPPSNTSLLYAVSSIPGGTVSVIALNGTASASGRAFATGIGTTGGAIRISSKGTANLDSANLLAVGDFSHAGHFSGGGTINVRSYSGSISWLSGVGDVRPVGSLAPPSAQGTIVLTACGSINTAGSQFPTTGPPTGPFPTTQTGLCSPAGPSLPAGEPALPTCNTPPVANAQTATTLEDNAVTITMTGSDVDGDPLTFTIVNPPAHGSLGPVTPVNSTSASVVYTPSANYNGSDSFTFQVADGKGGTSNATVTINITPVNDAPNFTVGPNPTSLEDGGPRTVAGFITGITPGPPDESAQTVAFSITGNSNPSLFAVAPAIAPNGTLTYTTAANANGSANITVVAQDNGGTANGGVDTSAPKNFTIFITAVNDAPSFTKGADQTVNEDAGAQSVAGWATAISAGPADESGQAVNFVVTGNSNPSLFSAAPAVSAAGTLTYTTAPNANGTAVISVAAHDDGGTANGGVDTSASQSFTVTVNAVNDAPSFTSGGSVTVLEDSGAYSGAWATAISAGPADESSQTVAFNVTANSNAALFAVQPTVAANGTLTFTPAANANGSATITVNAQDNGGTANGGVDTSAAQSFTINVTAVNDAPSFTAGGNVSVNEDSGAYSAPWASGISAGPNEGGQTVTFTVATSDPSLFAVAPAVSSSGVLTFTTAANANGTATITVTAHDDGGTANSGVDSSAPQSATITITAVNDTPSFTKGADQSVLEDSGAQTVPGWATGISAGPADESGQAVTFTTTAANTVLFAVQPSVAADGTLTYTPAANAFGSTTVTVTAQDNGGTANGGADTSAPQTFTITITAVNDAPSFTAGGNVTVNEDSGAYSAPWASGISAGPNEGSQTVTFTVTTSDPSLFAVAPAVSSTGVLTFTTATNANGSATITVTAHDDGGTANGGVDSSAPQSATITITAVNDAPSFTSGGDVTVLEDSGSYSAAWATGISAGPADESGQTVSFTITGNSNGALFASGPSISASGVLTFTPAANAFGSATITIVAQDNGGTANGGADTSAPVTFIINVTGVNDAPSFNKGPDVTVASNAGPHTFPVWATSISAGPNEVQTVSFTVTNDNNGVFTGQPAVSSSGTLTFNTVTTAPTTTVSVSVVAHDNGGTANGGVDTSAAQTFAINIQHANEAPVAVADTYAAIGNTELAVGTAGTRASTLAVATGSLLDNDTDADTPHASLTAALAASSAGAIVTVNADGTFTYLPPVNFVGDDTFTYTVSDGTASTTGTVTVHVTHRVRYVQNNLPAGNGRIDSPYNTVAVAAASALDNDTIYLFAGDGTTANQASGVSLTHDGERLIGEGAALTFSGPFNENGQTLPSVTLRAAGARPKITNAAGNGVTVAGAGAIAGLEVSGIEVATAGANGVSITNVNGMTMTADKIVGTTRNGVGGTLVSSFSFTNGIIDSTGTLSDDSNIAFHDAAAGTERNLSGTVTITGNTLTNALYHGVDIRNFNGTISNLDISGNTLTSGNTTTLSKGSAVRVQALGSAGTVASISQGSINNNVISRFPSGGGILVTGGNSAAAGAPGVLGSAANPITVNGNSIAGDSAVNRMGTTAIAVTVNGKGQGRIVVDGNGTAVAPITNIAGTAISCAAFGNVTVACTANNNFIVANNISNSPGISAGADQAFGVTDTPFLTLAVTNNHVSGVQGNGILATVRNTNGSGKFTITGNVVAAPVTASSRQGIRVDSGNGLGTTTVCLSIAGNVSVGSTVSAKGIGLRRQAGASVFGITGMAATSSPAVEAYVDSLNPAGGGTLLLSATTGFSNCTLP